MKEFVFGTNSQFDELRVILKDHLCHVYKGCELPSCCNMNKCRIGFEQDMEDMYIFYIDKGIQADTDHVEFKELLEKGEIKFLRFEDLVDFLYSLQPLFKEEDAKPVYDPSKVKELQTEAEVQRMVWPDEIACPLKKKVYGQDDAIDEIAQKIVINKMRKTKKLLVMALIGPTATGKSETAKSLADTLSNIYNTPYGFIELAGSEFIGEHTVHRFFGSPPGYVGYGDETVLEPVRKNPKHVIVINEIEKADVKLLTGLMEAIDTGYLGMADNSKPIDLNECILFFTSNIPINMKNYQSLSKFEKAEMCRDAFTKHCGRPEISGKIGNFVVFNSLSNEATMDIVVKFIKEELCNYELKLVRIDECLMVDFLKHQTKYGARGIRDLISDSLGQHLLKERKLEKLKGKSVSLSGTIDNIEFKIV